MYRKCFLKSKGVLSRKFVASGLAAVFSAGMFGSYAGAMQEKKYDNVYVQSLDNNKPKVEKKNNLEGEKNDLEGEKNDSEYEADFELLYEGYQIFDYLRAEDKNDDRYSKLVPDKEEIIRIFLGKELMKTANKESMEELEDSVPGKKGIMEEIFDDFSDTQEDKQLTADEINEKFGEFISNGKIESWIKEKLVIKFPDFSNKLKSLFPGVSLKNSENTEKLGNSIVDEIEIKENNLSMKSNDDIKENKNKNSQQNQIGNNSNLSSKLSKSNTSDDKNCSNGNEYVNNEISNTNNILSINNDSKKSKNYDQNIFSKRKAIIGGRRISNALIGFLTVITVIGIVAFVHLLKAKEIKSNEDITNTGVPGSDGNINLSTGPESDDQNSEQNNQEVKPSVVPSNILKATGAVVSAGTLAGGGTYLVNKVLKSGKPSEVKNSRNFDNKYMYLDSDGNKVTKTEGKEKAHNNYVADNENVNNSGTKQLLEDKDAEEKEEGQEEILESSALSDDTEATSDEDKNKD